MRLAPSLPLPARRTSKARPVRCHPLMRRGGADLDQALLELHATQEMEDFWAAARKVLHTALPLHFICMCLRPFALMANTVFRERAPFASEEEFRRFQEVSPVAAHLAALPGTTLVRISDLLCDAELMSTEFYRRFMLPHEDRYFACLNFWHGSLFQGLIGLHRTSAQHDFTDAEMALLNQLHPHFDTALQRILSLHRERAVRLSLEKLLVNLPIATVLLDWDMRVTSRNHSAVELCALWNLGPERATREKHPKHFQLPAPVQAFCEDFKARWNPCLHRSCELTSPSGVYFTHPAQPGLRASVNLLQLDAAPLSMPMFLVRIEDHRATIDADNRQEASIGLLSRLSQREREVAQLVGQGLSNNEVARQLRKSVLTVKRQLRSIFQKLDVPSRGRLAALLH
jgi:DNA-binding CsgD family transcriptional regulator